MNAFNKSAPTAPDDKAVVQRLSTRDRLLPLWIGAAMAAGLLLGRSSPAWTTLWTRSRSARRPCRSRSACC